jgi:tetratricopeptide (TPR) repeat protein
MTRDQMTWLGGGLAFGFVAGFVLAYAMSVETTVGRAAPPVAPAPAGATAAPQGGDPHVDVRGLLDDLNRRLEEDPQDVEVLSQLAEIYMQAGMADQAIAYLDRLDEAQPGMFQSQLMRAMALEVLGREEEFASQVTSMAETFPERWESHYLLAAHLISHHHNEGDLNIARRELDRIDELRPEMPETAKLRAELDQIVISHDDEESPPG